MPHSQHDDPNLAEVKAVLERLHRISRGPHADDMQTAKKQAPPRKLTQAAERPVPEEDPRSEEHTSELQSRQYLVCRLLLEKKKKRKKNSKRGQHQNDDPPDVSRHLFTT